MAKFDVFVIMFFTCLLHSSLLAGVKLEERAATSSFAEDEVKEFCSSDEKENLWCNLGLIHTNNLIWREELFESQNFLYYSHLREILEGPVLEETSNFIDLANPLVKIDFRKIINHGFAQLRKKYGSIVVADEKMSASTSASMRLVGDLQRSQISHFYFKFENDGQNTFNDDLSIRWINKIFGFGVFAAKDLDQGVIAGEYAGKVYYLSNQYDQSKEKLAENVEILFHLNKDRKYDKVDWESPHYEELPAQAKDSEDQYVAMLLRGHPNFLGRCDLNSNEFALMIVDAYKYRNEMAFVNHSEEENLEPIHVLKVSLEIKESTTVIKSLTVTRVFRTKRKIRKGEQLVYNYYWKNCAKADRLVQLPKSSSEVKAEETSTTISDEIECCDFENQGSYYFGSANACAECKKECKAKRCAACNSVFYCGSDCQRKDWPNHKKFCRKISRG